MFSLDSTRFHKQPFGRYEHNQMMREAGIDLNQPAADLDNRNRWPRRVLEGHSIESDGFLLDRPTGSGALVHGNQRLSVEQVVDVTRRQRGVFQLDRQVRLATQSLCSEAHRGEHPDKKGTIDANAEGLGCKEIIAMIQLC